MVRVIDPREAKSAEEIASDINDSVQVLPGLETFAVEIARLPEPDADGCNWTAQRFKVPIGCPPESERLLHDIIGHAKTHFRLWDVH